MNVFIVILELRYDVFMKTGTWLHKISALRDHLGHEEIIIIVFRYPVGFALACRSEPGKWVLLVEQH